MGTWGSKVFLAVVAALLLGSVAGVFVAFRLPTEREKEVVFLDYKLTGQFSHVPYGPPDEKPKPNPVFFTKTVDSIEASYNYRFLAERPAARVVEDVEVRAVVGGPDLWQKEVVLAPSTRKEGDFTVSFPLDPAGLLQLAGDISKELGVGAPSPEITLKALVHTVASTDVGQIEEDFVQTSKIKVGAATLEWERPLSQQERGDFKGVRYEERGGFGYVISLKENPLWGRATVGPEPELELPPWWSVNRLPTQTLGPEPQTELPPWWLVARLPKQTLGPEPEAPSVPVPLKVEPAYSAETLERIDVSFSYKMESGKPVKGVAHEVQVEALLGPPGGPAQNFVLVPRTRKKDDLTITFPLDMGLFFATIKAAEKERKAPAPAYDLVVKAEVKSLAETASGAIDEAFSQSVTVHLEGGSVAWPDIKPKVQSSSLKGKALAPNRLARIARTGSLGTLGGMAMVLLYGAWSYWGSKAKRISPMDVEALQARIKRRDILVDVESLPPLRAEEIVIQMSSLQDLITAADASLKLVLHQAEPERHTYCVIDGMTRYLYLTRLEEGARGKGVV